MSQAAESRAPLRTNIIWSTIGVLWIALLCGAGWVGWRAYHVYQGIEHITSVKVPREPHEKKVPLPPLNGNKRFNVLVLGSDNDRKSEEKQPLTQSMIVVTIDPVHDKVTLFSIPRDFWVPIKGHGYDKIDVAAKYGGIQLARYTVEQLFHIPIHYYAWVGLSGFRSVVDTFNGLDLDVQHPILDDFYPDDQNPNAGPYAFTRVFIPPGWRHLSGRQALEYVRSRHADAIGDFGRSARQQQVLSAMRKRANALNVVLNLPALVDDLQNSVRTDLSLFQIYQLAQLSRHISPGDIRHVVLQAPKYCQYGTAYTKLGAESILVPNWKAINPLVRSVFAPISTAAPKAPPPAPAPTRSQPVATSVPARVSPAARPTVPGPPAPVFTSMPGRLIYEAGGNVFELTRSRRVVQLTNCSYVCNAIAMPSLSPDGRTLAFVRFSTNYASDIYLLDLRTHAVRQLTHDANSDVHNNLWAAWPAWSPDGKQLLISSDRAKLTSGYPETESRPIDLGVWRLPADGSASTQLTTPVPGAGGDTDATFQPGTNNILYVHWAYDQTSGTPYSQLVLHDPTTGSTWYLNGPGQRVLQPSIDASGRNLTYVLSMDNQSEVIVAPLLHTSRGWSLGSGRVVASGEVAQPAFTPDGRWISYLAGDGNGFSLYVVSTRGGTAQQIGEVGSNMDAISRPTWTH